MAFSLINIYLTLLYGLQVRAIRSQSLNPLLSLGVQDLLACVVSPPLPCTFANRFGDVSAFGRHSLACATPEIITVRHEETRAGIAKMEKMETNLAEIPKNQQIQSFADVGWFVPSRSYCFQHRYLSVCSAVGVDGTRARSWQVDHGQALRPKDVGGWAGGDPANTGQHPGSWSPWAHPAAELPSCPKTSL